MATHYRTIWLSDNQLGNAAHKSQNLRDLLENSAPDHFYLVVDNLECGQIKIGLTYPIDLEDRNQKFLDQEDSQIPYHHDYQACNDDTAQPSQQHEQAGPLSSEDNAWLFFTRQ